MQTMMSMWANVTDSAVCFSWNMLDVISSLMWLPNLLMLMLAVNTCDIQLCHSKRVIYHCYCQLLRFVRSC